MHNRFPIAIAGPFSPKTTGYLFIVQISDAVYRYGGLKSLCQGFNDFTYDGQEDTNLPIKSPNPQNCLRFIVDFPPGLTRIPELPGINQYVQILYDPVENGTKLITDSATARTPVFDSVPARPIGAMR